MISKREVRQRSSQLNALLYELDPIGVDDIKLSKLR